MIAMVVNTKGGVGKSAYAMHVLAPYMLSRMGNATLIEVDDENHDASDYTHTAIDCVQVKMAGDANRAVEKIITSTSNKDVVIDVGGNKTATMFLEAAGNNGLDKLVDLIIIPVSQTGKDVENAGKTLEIIKNGFKGFKGAIFLGITRLNNGYSHDDIEYVMPDAIELAVDASMAGMVALPESDSIPSSRRIGFTAWELSQQSDNFLQEIEEAIYDLHAKGGEAKRIRELVRKKRATMSALELKPVLESIFSDFDVHMQKDICAESGVA